MTWNSPLSSQLHPIPFEPGPYIPMRELDYLIARGLGDKPRLAEPKPRQILTKRQHALRRNARRMLYLIESGKVEVGTAINTA